MTMYPSSRPGNNLLQIVVRSILVLLVYSPLQNASAADDLVNRWYMQPTLKLSAEDDPFRLLNHKRIRIGQTLSKKIDLEITLLSDNNETGNNNRGILVDGRYYIKQSGSLDPYIAGGFAKLKGNNLDRSYDEPSTNIGLGLVHTLKGNGARIQADIRYFMDDNQFTPLRKAYSNDWTMSLGITIPLSSGLFK